MVVLGVNGSLFGEFWHEPPPIVPYRPYFEGNHDAAAVLLNDSRIIAAVEQERVDRIKHSGGFPIDAIRKCLQIGGLKLPDVGIVAMSYSAASIQSSLERSNLQQGAHGGTILETQPETFLATVLERAFDEPVDKTKFRFVKHHFAHAASAYWPSGFKNALVATFDGGGEDESGLLCLGVDGVLETIQSFSHAESLGTFYLNAIRGIGLRLFEEYKAMGLAPYGDASRYSNIFREFYSLKSEGKYIFHPNRMMDFMRGFGPRRRGEPFDRRHIDFTAAAQQALEKIVFHVLEHARHQSGMTDLCLAGGVAHNCTMTGKLQRAGIFNRVYVQPASHDAGLALGSALCAYKQETGLAPPPLPHVYLGLSIGEANCIESEIRRWSDLIEFRCSSCIEVDSAQLLADGQIIGWVQGRSEFGPRALGNRSILADPRPAENKNIINEMVKKREGFRPFAPAVIDEAAAKYFDLPPAFTVPFMNFVVDVRPEYRSLLGAVCHVDGSARVQTVSKDANKAFWTLIVEFGKITGVPVLLNTSFNNNLEPIVESVADSIVCFLTTGLNALVIGNMVVKKREGGLAMYAGLVPRLPPHVLLKSSIHHKRSGARERRMEIGVLRPIAGNAPLMVSISREMYDMMSLSTGGETIGELIESCTSTVTPEHLLGEFIKLWTARLLVLSPDAQSPEICDWH